MDDHKKFNVNQAVVLMNGESDILLLAHARTGKWFLPGGRLEEGDSTPLDGLRREIREETGIENFEIDGILDVGLSDSKDSYLVTFACRVEGAPEIRLSGEHRAYAWVGRSVVGTYDLWHPGIGLLIEKYFDTTRHGK